MRSIKFRAWDTTLEKMLDMKEIERSGMNLFALCEGVNIVKLMQYTGLTDRNGKESYEGDIVKYKTVINDFIGTIRFGEYEQDGSGGEYSSTTCLGFYIQRDKIIPTEWDIECGGPVARDEDSQVSPCKCEMEIIGNIYENPELLEVS